MVMLMPAIGRDDGAGASAARHRARADADVLSADQRRLPRSTMTLPGAVARSSPASLPSASSSASRARMLMGGLQTAGTVIANQLGLGFVTTIDPTHGPAGRDLFRLPGLLAVTLIFAADLHHLVIAALLTATELFPPGRSRPSATPPTLITEDGRGRLQDRASRSRRRSSSSASSSMRASAVLSRLMPQMQVFFIALPATIMLGLSCSPR